eukprot:6193441-Pleurochrysis_carterae.AAC.1
MPTMPFRTIQTTPPCVPSIRTRCRRPGVSLTLVALIKAVFSVQFQYAGRLDRQVLLHLRGSGRSTDPILP